MSVCTKFKSRETKNTLKHQSYSETNKPPLSVSDLTIRKACTMTLSSLAIQRLKKIPTQLSRSPVSRIVLVLLAVTVVGSQESNATHSLSIRPDKNEHRFGGGLCITCEIRQESCRSYAWFIGQTHVSSRNISYQPMNYTVEIKRQKNLLLYTICQSIVKPKDLEKNLRCECDFKKREVQLYEILESALSLPESVVIRHNKENSTLDVIISEANPRPTCTVFDEKKKSVNTTISYKRTLNPLLRTIFSFDVPKGAKADEICKQGLKLSCNVGHRALVLPEIKNVKCSEKTAIPTVAYQHSNIAIYIILPISTIGLVGFVVYCNYRQKNSGRSQRQEINPYSQMA